MIFLVVVIGVVVVIVVVMSALEPDDPSIPCKVDSL